ncbi:MAG TPA: cytochrome c [Terracidiphilus sp.]
MLKSLLLLPAVAFFALGAASSSATMPQESSTPAKTSKAETAKSNEAATHAKKIYEVDCALCHGSNGNGKTDLAKDMSLNLNDFTDPKTLQSKTDDQIFDLIRKGKDKMPGEDAGRAKNEDVKAIIQYIRNMSKDQPAVAPAAPAAPAEPAPAPPAPTASAAPSSN